MHGFEFETFTAHASREQRAELNVVIDDKHAIHGDLLHFSDAIPSCESFPRIYKTLRCLTNLDRTEGAAMLESECSEVLP